MAVIGHTTTLSVPSAETTLSLPLPRKRGREWMERARGLRFVGTYSLAARQVELPPPPAGEGWGEGISSMGLPMVDPEHPDWKVPPKLRANARTLRRNSTDAERILWSELRAGRLNGASFRRQVPIEHYIADFICHAAKLVIELDGGQHFSDEGERADARRSAAIEAKGFKVLRFSNLDVMTNRGGVLETIATTVAERAPTPALPRKREREQTVSVEKKQP
ncbi:very-short-patch-repair endonuclease [Bradyrhizobium huanghuaihaiense]|uniref:Very-short-patch-repair endonuclease n=2 Tax=Bradyrhizobium huanghuaihaiense TaxID=990078 RepID=A0A562S5G3_9BRAD|nr:very-short-patch-repair endonuclease [Bradyrhizobium huanghuaihaiense]